MKEISQKYMPEQIEDRLYQTWQDKNYFKPIIDKSKKPFTVMMPPPNITGKLHMGHALDQTVQDIFVRYNRMKGVPTLWVPGTDHASIATEVKVVAKLEKEGIKKENLTREQFLKEAWAWKEEFGGAIVSQVKKIGSSCDWDRERFTLDADLNEAVKEVFIRLYNKGLIYRGVRIVNWCPDCKTSISDTEVEYEEQEGNLWHVRYQVEGTEDYLTVATTRPETMLGDTAVAIHPEDERYEKYKGKNVILPILNKVIPIVEDTYVEKDFGTGVVKITPAHDPNDFEVGQRHNLEVINVMNENATMNELAGEYANMDRYEARKAIVAKLEEIGALVKIEKHVHNVGTCYRCHTVVEPYASKQWFVAMKSLAEPAIKAVREDEIEFIPERFEKTYFNWMENIKDWCISRQLWWGHRIPAFHCECGETLVGKEEEYNCPKCGCKMEQDEDVLDTWFSSALWPFSTLGWPNKTEDFDYFYPTSTLVTGYDIIPFWVSKMIFSGIEFTGKNPFRHVYIHGLVRDSQGRKMSKSLGNGVDPLTVISEYGADALRLALIQNLSPGNDLKYLPEKVESSKNFANKIWNAVKFAQIYLKDVTNVDIKVEELSIEDKWIMTKLSNVINEVSNNIDNFDIGVGIQKIYDFIWSDICDTYIEMIKVRLYDKNCTTYNAAVATLNYVLKESMKLLHPYMPFVTEELYLGLVHLDESIVIAKWPVAEYTFDKETKEVEKYIETIRQIRNVRAESNIPMSKKINVAIITEDNTSFEMSKHFISKLAGIGEISYTSDEQSVSDFYAIHQENIIVNLDLTELVDKDAERNKIIEEKELAQKEYNRAVGMLSNQKFISKAPEALVNAEKDKKEKYELLIKKLDEKLNNM